MISADNLNLDCLELIFAYLNGNDLVSVSLVSRSFLAGVIPRLYRTLYFKLGQTKRYPAGALSPFASVLAHPSLSVHVRHIDIRAVPSIKNSLYPKFMNDCTRTLEICNNLSSFTCTPNVLPSFLLALQGRKSLQQLRVNASLTTEQAEQLIKIPGLQNLTLDSGTWNVVDMLPKWATVLKPSLTSLTLYSMHELNELVLGSALSDLPQLTSLHVIECSKVDHTAILRLISHTPFLESLSFTSWESPRVLPTSISALHYLRHLTVDTHCTLTPSATPSLWTSIIALTRSWSCSLKSLTLRLSDKLLLGDAFIKDVLDVHHATLTHLALLNCGLSLEGTRLICSQCTSLQRLAVSVPTKEIHGFSQALARSRSLHTLTDVGDIHHSHAQRAPISKLDVRTIMEHVQSLEKVIADGRVWAADRTDGFMGEGMRLYVQKRASSSPAHWFMPP